LVIFSVLDLFRYRRNAGAPGLAAQVGPGAPGLFLPAYSRELYLMERPSKVAQRCALCSRYHPTYRGFQAAIPKVVDALPTKCSQQQVSFMTLNFHQFDDVSLMPA
jgi:hypothetical protein